MKENKLAYLEGLRGIAALIVVFSHLKNTFATSFTDNLLVQLNTSTGSYWLSNVLHSFVNILFDGDLAVYIFWFMSAYVISIKLFVNNDKQYLFKSFSKRYFRLMIPVMGSILFAYLLLRFGLMYNMQVAEKLGPTYQYGWLGSFYQFDASIIGAIKSGLWNSFFRYDELNTYNSSLWTMNPELYGSIFCFFLFGVIGNNKYRYAFYLLIMCGAFIMMNYYLISFLLGFLMCDIDHSPETRIKNIVYFLSQNKYINFLIFFCLIIIGGKPDYWGFINLGISTLMVILIMRTVALQRVLLNKFILWLGKISFSLYLIHAPLICSFSCYLYLNLDMDHHSKIVVTSILTIAFALSLAHFFEKFVDRNGVKFANKFANWLTKE